MNFLRSRPAQQKPVDRLQVIIEELAKLEIEIPQVHKTPQNLRALQSAQGVLRGLSFRL